MCYLLERTAHYGVLKSFLHVAVFHEKIKTRSKQGIIILLLFLDNGVVMSPKCQKFVLLLFTCSKICLERYKIWDKFCDSFQGSLLLGPLTCTAPSPFPAPSVGYQKSPKHPKDKKHKNKAASLCYTRKTMASLNVLQANCFWNYILTIKQLKDRFLWRGWEGGQDTPW